MATWADVSRIVGARVADEGVKFALIADQPTPRILWSRPF